MYLYFYPDASRPDYYRIWTYGLSHLVITVLFDRLCGHWTHYSGTIPPAPCLINPATGEVLAYKNALA